MNSTSKNHFFRETISFITYFVNFKEISVKSSYKAQLLSTYEIELMKKLVASYDCTVWKMTLKRDHAEIFPSKQIAEMHEIRLLEMVAFLPLGGIFK